MFEPPLQRGQMPSGQSSASQQYLLYITIFQIMSKSCISNFIELHYNFFKYFFASNHPKLRYIFYIKYERGNNKVCIVKLTNTHYEVVTSDVFLIVEN